LKSYIGGGGGGGGGGAQISNKCKPWHLVAKCGFSLKNHFDG
jgi:hypothetical protein